MVVLERLCAIIHITICLPTLWLSGNCRILADYNWFVRSMGKLIGDLETTIEDIEEKGT